jgi:hypothetical protein
MAKRKGPQKGPHGLQQPTVYGIKFTDANGNNDPSKLARPFTVSGTVTPAMNSSIQVWISGTRGNQYNPESLHQVNQTTGAWSALFPDDSGSDPPPLGALLLTAEGHNGNDYGGTTVAITIIS